MAITATELKNRLSETMERAQHEPVSVLKNGRPYAVLLSQREFELFQALEDRYWGEKALAASKSGDYVNGSEALRELGVTTDEAA
jgi:prevent-host-death family protein